MKPKILLIGQDAVQQQCVGLLEASGFQVETLRYDPETRALLPEQKPHLVVIEISERSSGWEEWLRQIRAEETVLPVIFVVAPEVFNQITEVIREEAADFLVLPYHVQTLLFRIGKVLEHRHLNEELQSLQRELRFRRNQDYILEERSDRLPFKSFKEAKQEFEKNYIMNVLRIAQGNVTEAARLAKKDRKDFYDSMKKHRIKSIDYRSQ